MAISDGNLVNASVTNSAFVSRTQDTSTTGKLALQHATSGGPLLNPQQDINDIFDTVGIAGEGDANRKNYSSNEIVADGDSRKLAIEKLDAEFNLTTGHSHSGAANDGAPISGETLVNNLLIKNKLVSEVFNDTVTTGSNQVLNNPAKGLVILTNASLVSIAGILPPANNSQFFVLMNSIGASLTIVNSNAASDDILTGTGSDFTLEDDAAAFFAYDSVSSRWKIIGGSGGGSGVAFQEVPTGTVNGINPTFGPLTYNPTDNNSVLVMVDGVVRNITTDYTVSTGTITFQAGKIPQNGQSVYAYYLTEGVPLAPVLSGTYRVEYRTVTSGEATANQLTLAYTPGTPSYVVLDLIGGGAQFYGSDFTVTGTTLSWSGGPLAGLVVAGDQFRIVYTE